MELQKVMQLIRRAVEKFETKLAEEGFEPDDEMEVEEAVDDFKVLLDEAVEEAAEAEEQGLDAAEDE